MASDEGNPPLRKRMENPDTRVIIRDNDPDADEDVTDLFAHLLGCETALARIGEIAKAFDISMSGQETFHPLAPPRVRQIRDIVQEALDRERPVSMGSS